MPMDIDFARLFLKICFYKKVRTDTEVGKLLGMSTAAVRERRTRNSTPIEQVKVFCHNEGLDFDEFTSDCRMNIEPGKPGGAKHVAAVSRFIYCLNNGTEKERLELVGRVAELESIIRYRKQTGDKS